MSIIKQLRSVGGKLDADLLSSGIQGLTRVFGRRSEAKVSFVNDGNWGANVETGEVRLPALPLGGKIDVKVADAIRGVTLHEGAHLAETERNPKDGQRLVDHFGGAVQAIANSFEDARIESKKVREYAGAKRYLEAAFDMYMGDTKHPDTGAELGMMAKYPDGHEMWKDPQHFLVPGLNWALREKIDIGSKTAAECLERLPDDWREWLRAKATEHLPRLKSTNDTLLVAEDILVELGFPPAPPPPPPPSSGEGQGGDGDPHDGDAGSPSDKDDGKDDKKEGDGASSEDKKEGDGAEGEQEGEGENSGGASGKMKGDGQGEYDVIENDGGTIDESETDGRGGGKGTSGSLSAGVEPPEKIKKSDLSKLTTAKTYDPGELVGGGGSTLKGYVPWNTDHDAIHDAGAARRGHPPEGSNLSARMNDPAYGERYQHSKDLLRGNIGVMMRKLERALQDMKERGWVGNQDKGRLDPRKFVNVVSALDMRAYKKRTDAEDLNAAVTLLVDLSGSMSGCDKDEYATHAVVAFSEVLNKLGVPFEVLGFCSKGGKKIEYEGGRKRRSGTAANVKSFNGVSSAKRKKYASTKWARLEALDHFVFKGFDDPLRASEPAIGSIPSMVGGNNCDQEAIAWAAGRLIQREEAKKVLMVLSDGSPAFDVTSVETGRRGDYHSSVMDIMNEGTKEAVAACERQGIICVGIGILDGSVKRFYPRNAVLKKLDQLQSTVMDEVSRAILGRSVKKVKEDAA